jgi:YkoY family integral membrane protein
MRGTGFLEPSAPALRWIDFVIMIFPLAAITVFGQVLELQDIPIILLLVVLEGVLSIDNALVLGLLAKRLPKRLQRRALTYGLVGAFIFRIIAIATATYLLRWNWAKLVGGAYLVYVALKHFFFDKDDHEAALAREAADQADADAGRVSSHSYLFWSTVLVIELTDIAFAIDSILAAIALVGQQRHTDTGTHDKLWVVVLGGMIGVVVMRFAAVLFIKLLEKFPRFEVAAYLLVIVIGGKLLADWGLNNKEHPHRVDFHDFRHPAFWIFWALMIICFSVGFLPKRNKHEPDKADKPPLSQESGGRLG